MIKYNVKQIWSSKCNNFEFEQKNNLRIDLKKVINFELKKNVPVSQPDQIQIRFYTS